MRRSLVNILIRLVSFRVNFLSFKDLKRFRLKPLFLAFSIAVIAASSFISTGIAAFLPATSVSAASPPTAIKGVCQNNFSFTQYSSPFQSTKGLCLGDDSQDHVKFFQFAIELPGAISGIKITGKDGSVSAGGSGGTIAFTKESATRYVSTDGVHQGLGYQASIGVTTTVCNKTSGSSTITFTISGGVNNPKPITSTINICDYWNKDYVIDQTPTGLKADNIAQVGSTGQILGNFCSIRNSNILPTSQQTGLLDQLGIMTITLNAINSNNSNSGHGIVNGSKDTWYTLTNGKLTIQNLKPDIYDLSFNYNDQLVLLQQDSIASADMTTNSLKISFSNVRVTAGADTWVTNPDGKTPTCYNNNGTVGNPNAPITTPSSCVVDGIGWMVCPIMNALGGLNDALYGWIQSVLVLNPLTQNDTSGAPTAQYQNWSIIRNIANVLLIIAFLLIIFSQISSIGISNYGVKKMLPRVILIAVAINLSWTIMSFAVDAVNIIGVGLHDLLNSAAVNANSQTIDGGNAFGSLTTGLVAGTAGLAVGGVVALSIAGGSTLVLIALPFIVGAALALLAAVITLFVRNALIIVLVIIAPVALVAYLLPNTEEYFKKWRKMLTSMLFLFPVAALLFAGAKFAAYVIVTSNQPLAQLTAIFVMAAPLGLLPWLARSSGGILASVNKQLGSMAKGVQNATQKGLAQRVETGKAERRADRRDFLGRQRNPYKAGDPETYNKDKSEKRDKNGNIVRAAHKAGDVKLDKDGNPIIGQGERKRRTVAGVVNTWNQGLKERADTAQKEAVSNYKDLGLRNDGSRLTAKVSGVIDAGKVEGLRGESIDAQYKTRLEVGKLQSGQTRDIYDRLQDANATTSSLEHEQTLRQKTRLQGNAANTVAGAVGLSRLSSIEGNADSNMNAAQAERLKAMGKAADIDLTGGGGLKILHENQEAAELYTQKIDKDLTSEFEERKAPGGNLANVQAQIDRSELSTENAKNAQQSAKEDSKLPDGENSDLFAKSIIGKAASDKTAAEQRRIEFEARLGVNQQRRDGSRLFTQETAIDENGDEQLVGGQLANIRDLDQDTQASSEAASYAEGGRTIKYAAAIDKGLTEGDERGRALAVAASGTSEKNIDGSQNYEQAKNADGDLLFEKDADGKDTNVPILDTTKPKVAILTEAKAAKTVLEDKQSDQNTIVSLAKSRSMPGGEALAYLGVSSKGEQLKDENGDIKSPPDISDAQKLGYIRYAAGRGDRQTSMALVSHVGELGRQANEARERVNQAEKAGKTPLKADQDIIRHAKEAQAVLLEAGDSSLPPWMGGSDRQKLAEGTFTGSVEENAFGAVATGKLTADAFAGMDIKNRDTFVSALNQMTTPSPEQTARLAGGVEAYKHLDTTQKQAIDDAALEENLRRSAPGLIENYTDLKTDEEREAAIDRVMPTVRKNFAQAVIPLEKAQFDDRINRGLAPRDIQRYDRMRERLLHIAGDNQPIGVDGKPITLKGKTYKGPIGAPYDDAGTSLPGDVSTTE
jgi:hypothetical protein